MSGTFQVYPSGTSVSGIEYTTTTLTDYLTTLLTSESVYEGETSTIHVGTVLPPGTEIVNQLVTSSGKKSNTVIIIGAALGGFLGLVIIVIAIYLIRRKKKRPRQVPQSPSLGYHSPLAPVTITPYGGYHGGYQSPETSQPYQHESLVVHEGPNVVMYPPQTSGKTRNQSLVASVNQNRPPQASRPSVDDAGSVLSQPYTSSSVYSTTTGGPNVAGGPQGTAKQRMPPHQRSLSATSDTSVGQRPMDNRNMMGQSPPGQGYYGPGPGGGGMPMGPVQEEYGGYSQPQYQQGPPQQSIGGRSNSATAAMPGGGQMQQQDQYYLQQQQHRMSYHAPPTQGGFASGSQGPSAGGMVTVDRGDRRGEQVVPAKNANMRSDALEDVDERLTNMPELPPTYDSLQNRPGASRPG